MPVSSIEIKGGLPVLTVNGESVLPCGYMSYQAEKADYAGFAAAGYRLAFAPVYAGDRGINPMSGIRPFCPGFWKGEDRFDSPRRSGCCAWPSAARSPARSG